MEEYQQVGKVSEVPESGKLTVELDDRVVVVIRVGDQFFCIDDVCTHDGGPLGEGQLDGFQIACPRHGALFDIRSGEALTMPATEPTEAHEIKIVDDQIWVRLAS